MIVCTFACSKTLYVDHMLSESRSRPADELRPSNARRNAFGQPTILVLGFEAVDQGKHSQPTLPALAIQDPFPNVACLQSYHQALWNLAI
jgi:hypothetical protein